MQHTKKYNFNLIETSDTFGPDQLNENTQKVEDQLAALESTHAADKASLEATQKSDKAALESAMKADKAALEATQKSDKAALESAMKADKAALETKLTALNTAVQARNCQFYYKAYTGNGSKNPIVHTFPHKPMFFFISSPYALWMAGVAGSAYSVGFNAGSGFAVPLTWGDKSLTVGVGDASHPEWCNTSGYQYYLFALLDVDK